VFVSYEDYTERTANLHYHKEVAAEYVEDIRQMAQLIAMQPAGEKIGCIVTGQLLQELSQRLAGRSVQMICLGDRKHPEELAANLFGALREADEKNLTLIYGEALPREGMGEAIMNRFLKAASQQLWMNQEEKG